MAKNIFTLLATGAVVGGVFLHSQLTVQAATAPYNVDFFNFALQNWQMTDFEVAHLQGNTQVKMTEQGLRLQVDSGDDKVVLKSGFNFLTDLKDLAHFTMRYDFVLDTVGRRLEFPLNYQNENNYVSLIIEQGVGSWRREVFHGQQISEIVTDVWRAKDPWLQSGRVYTFEYVYYDGYAEIRIWPKGCYQRDACGNDFAYQDGDIAAVNNFYVNRNYGPALALQHDGQNSAALDITYQNFFVFDAAGGWQMTVPFFSQRDPAWRSDPLGKGLEFDNDATIGSHGCAITSAAMLLNYYGYALMPDGQPLTPATLNVWLAQNGGFVMGTYVVWEKIVQLAQEIAVSQPSEAQKTFQISTAPLVGSRGGLDFHLSLDDLTTAGEPVILATVNHFMVAHGLQSGQVQSVVVNDPWQDEANLLWDERDGAYGAINGFRRFMVEENPNQSGIVISYTGALKVAVWDVAQKTWAKSVETTSKLPGELTLQQVYVERPTSGDYVIQIVHNPYSYNPEPRRYTLMTYDKLGQDKVFFSENYNLLVAPQLKQRLRTVGQETWQSDYDVSFILHFDQDAASETRLELNDPNTELKNLTSSFFDSQTPEFVKKQIKRLMSAWRESNFEVRYLDLLKLYFDHFAKNGWLNVDRITNLEAQLAALLPYLAGG